MSSGVCDMRLDIKPVAAWMYFPSINLRDTVLHHGPTALPGWYSDISPVSLFQLTVQLDDPSLLHFDSFVGNEWVQSKHGERFEVVGMCSVDCPRG